MNPVEAAKRERLFRALSYIELCCPNVVETELAQLMYYSQTVEVQTFWNIICSAQGTVIAVLRLGLRFMRNERVKQVRLQYNQPALQGFQTAAPPPAPTAIEDDIAIRGSTERSTYTIEFPEIFGPPTKLTPEVTVMGNVFDRTDRGVLVAKRSLHLDRTEYHNIQTRPLTFPDATVNYLFRTRY